MKLYALGETARDREREMFVKEAKKQRQEGQICTKQEIRMVGLFFGLF